ncbi:MAG: gamma-glutamyl-gamma-aminobutyrate hydrolase family protein [Syntrophomonadaceae bacterium]|jgi:putative glutamine amidotransferase|nr:gamma-glutamyl-gamma-aminobutyrate hydrolase family protein [Syntrophomonadaceae bacterium]
MDKPIIGVTPIWDEDKNSIWMEPGYMNGIAQAGGIPVILPLAADKSVYAQIAHKFDGFLFTGGYDIAPVCYNEKKSPRCGFTYVERDKSETVLFREALLRLDKPVFGICRGIQLFNVIMGGVLYQDIPTEFESSVKLEHNQEPPYDVPVHKVRLKESGILRQLLGTEEIAVNSCHHQGIKILSDQLETLALSEDGLVEAVRLPGKTFAIAVQWHPELAPRSEVSRKLFRAFVESCKQLGLAIC